MLKVTEGAGMISFEKLTSNRIKQIQGLMKDEENKRDYRLNFIEFYNKKNKLIQYFYRKNMYLIKYDTNYIGYIWLDTQGFDYTKILDFFIQREYLTFLNGETLKSLGSAIICFETLEDENNIAILEKLEMKRTNTSKLFKLKVSDVIIKERKTVALFKQYELGEDAQLRCDLQNEIFNSKSRIPLCKEDIILEERQDYFIKELSLFIKVSDKEVGYGQIVYNRGVYTIVNFGLIEEYRNRGFGADLLLLLIQLANLRGIEEIFIRVDPKNTQAMELYKSVGFLEIGEYASWYYYGY